MRAIGRSVVAAIVLIAVGSKARAQGIGSLGGYGGSMSPGMAASGPMLVPYGGSFEGFMPGRMGGGSSLAFRPRTAPMTSGPRTAFRLSPMAGGMTLGMPGRSMTPMGGSVATPIGGMRRAAVPGGSGVMPPAIGYPFRQPPSLLSPAAPGPGMGM